MVLSCCTKVSPVYPFAGFSIKPLRKTIIVGGWQFIAPGISNELERHTVAGRFLSRIPLSPLIKWGILTEKTGLLSHLKLLENGSWSDLFRII